MICRNNGLHASNGVDLGGLHQEPVLFIKEHQTSNASVLPAQEKKRRIAEWILDE
jgi:hypothetical protein